MVSTADFSKSPVDSGVILQAQVEASALAKLVKKISLPGSGAYVHEFTTGGAEYVAEGALKPVVDVTGASVLVDAIKFAKVVVLTKELAEDSPAIANAILQDLPASFASTLDRIVIGDTSKPTGNIDSLVGAPTQEVSTVSDLYAAYDTVEATGATVDGILFTSSYLNYLRGKVNDLGLPVFSIGANDIDGIPFAVVRSSTRNAWVGPFASRAVWGVVDGYPKVDISTDAPVTVDGKMISLFQENKIGVLGETRVGFRVANVNEFVKLTAPTAS